MQENHSIDILLVDDRPNNLLTMEAVLASPEYNLVKATSGDQALRYLLHNDPALILMDVQMPELDGFQTTELIKQSERSRDIPIIFITALNKDERYVQKGYAGGAVDYLFKPFDPVILRSKVSVFAELYRKNKALIKAKQLLIEDERKERERRLAQLQLKSMQQEQREQQKYRDLVEGISHGIVWSADPDTLTFSFVSPHAERILGYPLKQWSTEEGFWKTHIHPEDQTQMMNLILGVKSSQKDAELEHRFITATGKTIWLHTGIRLGRKSKGSGYELRGLSVDISKMKAAESALRKNHERSEFLAEASLLLSASLDYETTLNHIGNLAIPKIADWYAIDILEEHGGIKSLALASADPTQVEKVRSIISKYPYIKYPSVGVAKVIHSGTPEIYSDFSKELLEKFIHDPEDLTFIQSMNLKSAMIVPLIARGRTFGSIGFVSTQSGHVYDENDLSMVQDLARRAAMAIDNAALYKHAQAAIRAHDEFLSIASHELKTPLTPLKLHSQNLMKTLKTKSVLELHPDKVEKTMQVFDRQLSRLSSLIENLLDISRISIGRLDLNPLEFNLVDLFKDILERFSDPLIQLGCKVSFSSPPSVPVFWDRFRMEQVILNLLTNAMKYGPGKPIEISLQFDSEKVTVSFRDHGIGIDKKDHGRIFERFERAVSPTHFGGLGLGLYIATQIIDAHHGQIHVESTPGEGATFTLAIPPLVNIPGKSEPLGIAIENQSPTSENPQKRINGLS